jgi:endonuclease-3 related protein
MPVNKNAERRIAAIYPALLDHFGFQHWWPGETRFEIVIGALLTQNCAWSNVEKAIANLKNGKALSLTTLRELPREQLEAFIRPTGYFRQKAERLACLLAFLADDLGWDGVSLIKRDTARFRRELLSISGIGPETADSILCYGFDRNIFVVDAYTKRILSRLPLAVADDYETIRTLFEKVIRDEYAGDPNIFKDLHAQIVMAGKHYCKKSVPLCNDCPLRKTRLCHYHHE